MSTDEILQQLEQQMARRRAAKMSEQEAADRIELLKLRLQLDQANQQPESNQTDLERFICQHNPPADILEFMERTERPTSECAVYLAVTADEVSRRLRRGIYQPGPTDSPGGKRMVDTLSVAKTFYAKTDKKT